MCHSLAASDNEIETDSRFYDNTFIDSHILFYLSFFSVWISVPLTFVELQIFKTIFSYPHWRGTFYRESEVKRQQYYERRWWVYRWILLCDTTLITLKTLSIDKTCIKTIYCRKKIVSTVLELYRQTAFPSAKPLNILKC